MKLAFEEKRLFISSSLVEKNALCGPAKDLWVDPPNESAPSFKGLSKTLPKFA